jgi:hypothetical protein
MSKNENVNAEETVVVPEVATEKKSFKKKKAIQEVEYNPLFVFEVPEDEFVGTILAIRKTTTDFGETDVIDAVDVDGEPYSLFMTSKLKRFDWTKLIGKTVCITYIGDKRNDKTKRMYKDFEVCEVEVD